ncbi:hypothetical protein [Dehalogenimonas etheniformans]|uniref:hypothetical protein n=1 Tax=Dehalogenimonas etheniformans TaxID=1536648 RepID=UPI00167F6AB7|nr:hypothetical protein [Dehalogenimonas etheniformans]QNT76234.1 hypothetical protein HX448_05795 [Dehalogenimonas etheniformans]
MPAGDFTIACVRQEIAAFAFRYPGSRLAFAGAPLPDESPVAPAHVLVAAIGTLATPSRTGPGLLNYGIREHRTILVQNPG